MAEKSHMPYLAIVVLVAVVAVVVLVLNFRPSSDEAVAGEAVRASGETWGAISRGGSGDSCADTCKENSVSGKGKCLAGYGFDQSQFVMRSVLSCGIKDIGPSQGPDLACLCIG